MFDKFVDELREKLVSGGYRLDTNEGIDRTIQFLSRYLEQETLKAKIDALNILYQNSTERVVAWDSEQSLRQTWLHNAVLREINNLSEKNDHIHKFTTIDSYIPYRCECGLLEEDYKN